MESVRRERRVRTRARRRWLLRLLTVVLVLAGARTLWRRYHTAPSQSISGAWPEIYEEAPPPRPEPIYFGPAWPPTDDDWKQAFHKANWIFPLPGPSRRACVIDGRILGPEPPKNLPARCRPVGHCGADLGGDLWGEHVYAAHDGVVERVQAAGNDERGGLYVRLAHFGGMVFTQYFHLAAIPRGIARGVRIKAGDVIGLVGDTGLNSPERHLHFALSIRPSNAFPEVYWDPQPWMVQWPLRVPANGTVAGFAFAERRRELPHRRRPR